MRELVDSRASERIERAKMPAGGIELVEPAAVLGRNGCIAARKPWQRRSHAADTIVDVVRDVEPAVRPHGDSGKGFHSGLRGGAAITAESATTASRDGADDPIRPDPADTAVA